jgi:hypothetical protein
VRASFPLCTSASQTTLFHHGGKLASATFLHKCISKKIITPWGEASECYLPYSTSTSTSTSTSRSTSFLHGRKLVHAIFPSYTSTSTSRTKSFHDGGKIACASFTSCTRMSTYQTKSSQCGGNLAHSNFLSCASSSAS